MYWLRGMLIFILLTPLYAQTINISREVEPQNIEQAQFYNVLTRISRCSPIEGSLCRFYISTSEDFIYYLKNCQLLNNWFVIYTQPSRRNLNLTLTAYENKCLITVTDLAKNVAQKCSLTKENIKALTNSSDLNNYIEDFDNHSSNKQSEDLLEALNQCLTTHPQPIKIAEQ